MTLVELLAQHPGGTWRDRVLTALYWNKHYGDGLDMTAGQVRAELQRVRVRDAKSANVPDVLGKAGPLVDTVGKSPQGHNLWRLTQSGETAVRRALGLPDEQPQVEIGVEDLRRVASGLPDSQVREYVEEAILCLSVGALRAACVFVWVGAAQTLRDRVWAHGEMAVNGALKAHNPKAAVLVKADDLAEIKESQLLQVAQDLGEIDKGQKQMLEHCLTLRNQCGHPGKYRPTANKAKAHIDDIVGILFS